MSQDTIYKSIAMRFASHGIIARDATDTAPQSTYLNLANCEEREENAMSTRYGSQIVSRDPYTLIGLGQNYYFDDPIHTLSRLKYGSATWRYAGSGENLYRRAGDTPGAYALISNILSGQRFSSVVNTCAQSAIPYLFIADQQAMLKDSGTDSPQLWGILPPNQTANTTEYAPQILLVDGFNSDTFDYDLVNVSGFSPVSIGTMVSSASEAVNDFRQYQISSGIFSAFNGVLATYEDGLQSLMFNPYSNPNPSQISGVGIGPSLNGSESNFVMTGYRGTVGENTVGTISKTVSLDFNQNNQVTDDDLIGIAMQLSDPSAVTGIKLMFDINNSGYSSSYYYKSISPAYYQSGIDGNTDAYETAADQILANTLGLISGSTTSSNSDSIISQLQTSTANTGPDAWSTIYNRRGDFLAVGNAGNPGFDWASITGWRIEVTTTSNASVAIAVNGLYLQWGFGPSSYGGVGYDYRYTYQNINTGTESNASPIQYFDEKYGFVASYTAPIVLRQAFNVTGLYSNDPQVTHVNIYRRGGTFSKNWFYLDQIPNIPGGSFAYKDILPDITLEESSGLQLDNDPPVTSSLEIPIVTSLSEPSVPPGTSPYSQFVPQLILVAQATATFFPGQIVDIGTPQNLEQVKVVTGGTGSFFGVMRLKHAPGEPVYVFSTPAVQCDLTEVAYNKQWVAGDKNNPNFLYYSKPGYPESFGPQNYIRVGTPDSNIMAVINWRGTLYVATQTSWFQIIDGAPPYAQPTGSTHGLVSKHGWTQTEGAIWYEAIDGIREFRGSDGAYRTLLVEWLYQGVQKTPVPLVDRSQLDNVSMAYQNNQVYALYAGMDGTNHRLIFNLSYGGRIRNDNVSATTMFYEKDTNALLYGKPLNGRYVIVQDRIGDYDDGGWAAQGPPLKDPIAMVVQTPFQDAGSPHNPKQWNMVEIDANTQGQDLNVFLDFEDTNQSISLGVVNTKFRDKVDLKVEEGFGQDAYRCSLRLQGDFSVAPVIYQSEIHVAVLAEVTNSFDCYWIKFGTDESKLIKQGYWDFTSTTPITVGLYADGDEVNPYFTFILAPAPNRAVVRVRYPALLMRTFRAVAVCDTGYQFWNAPRVEWKRMQEGSSFAVGELVT